MIIDSHAYCFEAANSSTGYTSVEEHLRWVQLGQAHHYQPAFRLKDRVHSSSEILYPKINEDINSLPDVNFRIDSASGRVVWTVNGEDYTKHYYPPNLRNCEFTPESLISEMDYANIDIALLHTNPMLGRDSAYLAECVRKFPGRIYSMAPVDEWRIRDNPNEVINELITSINDYGLHAIKFNPTGYMTSPEPWDDGFYRPFWEVATSLNIPIFFSLGSGPGRDKWEASPKAQDAYLNELNILIRWMDRYPNNVCSITHGFPYRSFLVDNQVVLPKAIWEPFKNPNLNIELSFPVRIGDKFDFPYHEVIPTIESMVNNIGADHLLYGTDMPFQNRHCTYQQSRDHIEKYCEFLNQEELDLIMGGTTARILNIARN